MEEESVRAIEESVKAMEVGSVEALPVAVAASTTPTTTGITGKANKGNTKKSGHATTKVMAETIERERPAKASGKHQKESGKPMVAEAATTIGALIDVYPPKGTRDFPPDVMRQRTWLFDHFREVNIFISNPCFFSFHFPVMML